MVVYRNAAAAPDGAWPDEQKAPRLRGFRHAPKRTRTSTDRKVHKALNLARLPIPPPAQVATEGPWGAEYSPRLHPSTGRATVRTRVRTIVQHTAEETHVDLTKRQQEIFDFIKRYSAKYGYPPTVRDIGKAVGLASSSTVHAHLANLEKLGLLRRDPSKPRAIELLDRMREELGGAVESAVGAAGGSVRNAITPGLPVVGNVAAGQPILAEENIEDYVQVPLVAGGEDGEYVLRVRGESMKDIGILEGDYVVVRPQETARDGEIVVALVGEEATVKRFFREPDHIRLQPENATMEPIRSKDVRVLGRVVGLLRNVA